VHAAQTFSGDRIQVRVFISLLCNTGSGEEKYNENK
jgi:hypothetical protein